MATVTTPLPAREVAYYRVSIPAGSRSWRVRLTPSEGDALLLVEQGALYPALARLEQQGLIESEWGVSENNRRAKFYVLTKDGKARLKSDTADWKRFAAALEQVLSTPNLEALA